MLHELKEDPKRSPQPAVNCGKGQDRPATQQQSKRSIGALVKQSKQSKASQKQSDILKETRYLRAPTIYS
jgi:hypothetical protein